MPHRITFVVDAFKGPAEERHSHNALNAMLRALTLIDVSYLVSHPSAPGIYDSGVRYEEEPPGQEDWQDIPTCLILRVGDCEDLSCWRAAELRVRHRENAWPIFRHQVRPNGSYLYHILVRRADGRIEDPSRILGMI
jgi:hypothetical protein